jgi:hypothetical protein
MSLLLREPVSAASSVAARSSPVATSHSIVSMHVD